MLTERFLDVAQSKGHAETHARLPDWELGPGRPASAGLRLVGGRSAGRRRGAASAAAGSLWEERDTESHPGSGQRRRRLPRQQRPAGDGENWQKMERSFGQVWSPSPDSKAETKQTRRCVGGFSLLL